MFRLVELALLGCVFYVVLYWSAYYFGGAEDARIFMSTVDQGVRDLHNSFSQIYYNTLGVLATDFVSNTIARPLAVIIFTLLQFNPTVERERLIAFLLFWAIGLRFDAKAMFECVVYVAAAVKGLYCDIRAAIIVLYEDLGNPFKLLRFGLIYIVVSSLPNLTELLSTVLLMMRAAINVYVINNYVRPLEESRNAVHCYQ